MKDGSDNKGRDSNGGANSGTSSTHATEAPPKRHRGWRRLGWVLVVLVVLLGIGRAILPWAVRKYVNRTLDRSLLYTGKIGPVEIHLWRGAYSIRDVRLDKSGGQVPVPFFAAKRLDFAVQWDALLHGKVVSRILIEQPELNFVAAPSEEQSQTGGGGPWLDMLQQLFPFKINRALIEDGSIHFRTYQSQKPVDVYISQVNASIDDLSNIRNSVNPLIATVQASGLVMNQARMDFKMTLDPFAYHPTFHMALRLLGLDVTKLNDLALTYGKFDFKRGWFDLVVQADAKEGQINGYVKPLFRHLKVFSLTQAIKNENPLQAFWEALIGATTTVFKNLPRNQFGTLIPFNGDLSGKTSIDILATLGDLLRNAFVRAYLPRLEPGWATEGTFQFQPPSFSEEAAAGTS